MRDKDQTLLNTEHAKPGFTWRLCYVEKNFAYFTTQELSQQTGDDWDDPAYEHNAGEPSEWRPSFDDRPEYHIRKVAWDGELMRAGEETVSSPYSVDMINAGHIAWLATPSWAEEHLAIPAGVSIEEFTALVRKAGGNVYLQVEE
jgi:hypothetical protein